MTDWIEKAEESFACAIAACMGMDPDSPKAADFIRFTNRIDDDSPQPARTKDVCYIAVSPRNGLYWAQTTTGEQSTTIDKTLPLGAQIVFYGPHATQHAEYCRTMLLMNRQYGSGRMYLEQAGIYLEALMNPPTELHEQEDGGWRKRCDLTIQAIMQFTEAFDSGYVSDLPEIDIFNETGSKRVLRDEKNVPLHDEHMRYLVD